jgi:preprotein translocase subunit SecA
MNSQREVIYTRRRNALYGERVDVDVQNMITDYAENLVSSHHGSSDFDEFTTDSIRSLSVKPVLTGSSLRSQIQRGY